jgi:hemerythrin
MGMILWRDDFSVEIQEIDEQHKSLVSLINQLYEALSTKQHRDQVGEVLHELVNYTLTHFAVEEALMRLMQYPDYEEHKQSHDRIAHKVQQFHADFQQGKANVDMELLMFLKEWLTTHIMDVDKRYAPHLKKHGVKQSWLQKFW